MIVESTPVVLSAGTLEPSTLLVAVGVVLIAGMITGIAGFGFALLGTMALATQFEPSVAIVLMIIPILGTNLSLLGELDRSSLTSCSRQFGPYIGAATVGTVIGMWLLESVPVAPLTLALGVLTLAYVGQAVWGVPGRRYFEGWLFVERPLVMVGLGGLSGLLFGATNVGVQIVAYVESQALSRGLFVGVIALIFLAINTIRVGAAGVFGLYPSLEMLVLSVWLAVPTVVGVFGGRRLQPLLSTRQQRVAVFGLLTLVGVRLVYSGLNLC